MNTQTHVLMGAVLFGGTVSGGQTAAAVVGGLLPDLPAILMVVWARWWAARSPREIFGTLYFSRRWQVLLAPWHSVPLWGAGVALGWASASPVLIAFAASGLIHVGIDFFLHASDAHRHFWPFSDWRFESPVSYWDSAHTTAVYSSRSRLRWRSASPPCCSCSTRRCGRWPHWASCWSSMSRRWPIF